MKGRTGIPYVSDSAEDGARKQNARRRSQQDRTQIPDRSKRRTANRPKQVADGSKKVACESQVRPKVQRTVPTKSGRRIQKIAHEPLTDPKRQRTDQQRIAAGPKRVALEAQATPKDLRTIQTDRRRTRMRRANPRRVQQNFEQTRKDGRQTHKAATHQPTRIQKDRRRIQMCRRFTQKGRSRIIDRLKKTAADRAKLVSDERQ
jgi:hypothetical protein